MVPESQLTKVAVIDDLTGLSIVFSFKTFTASACLLGVNNKCSTLGDKEPLRPPLPLHNPENLHHPTAPGMLQMEEPTLSTTMPAVGCDVELFVNDNIANKKLTNNDDDDNDDDDNDDGTASISSSFGSVSTASVGAMSAMSFSASSVSTSSSSSLPILSSASSSSTRTRSKKKKKSKRRSVTPSRRRKGSRRVRFPKKTSSLEEVHIVDSVADMEDSVHERYFNTRLENKAVKSIAIKTAKLVFQADKDKYTAECYSFTMWEAYKLCRKATESNETSIKKRSRTKLMNWMKQDASRRGLERWSVPALNVERNEMRDRSILCVMDTQEKLRSGAYDHVQDPADVIAAVYSNETRCDAMYAQLMGQADAISAKEAMMSDPIGVVADQRKTESQPNDEKNVKNENTIDKTDEGKEQRVEPNETKQTERDGRTSPTRDRDDKEETPRRSRSKTRAVSSRCRMRVNRSISPRRATPANLILLRSDK